MSRLAGGSLRGLATRVMVVVAFIAAGAYAQNQSAQVSGLITDPSGAVVPRASLALLNKDTGLTRTSESNNEGYYVIPLLQPGNYSMTVKASGFETAVRDGINLQIAQNARIDFTLQVGATQQMVQVSANASPLNYDNAELKTGISPQTLTELPLIVSGGPRNMGALVTLVPGVSSPVNDPGSAHINGGLIYEGETILDGIGMHYTGGYDGLMNVAYDLPQSPDMISEVKVLTSNYEPQYGNSASGAMILETKSGTDVFHGSLFEYNRNTDLNARQFGSPTVPEDIENEFGGSIGGPVKIPGLRSGRSKPFFFVDWEGFRQAGGLTRSVLSIPSLQERQGDFTDWKDSNGNLIPIYDPATTKANPSYNPNQPTGPNNLPFLRDQFMGCDGATPNVICSSDPRLQNSLASQWFKFLPNPTSPGPLNNYLAPAVPNVQANRNFLDFRVDEYFGEKDHFSASAYWQKFPTQLISVLPPQLANERYCATCGSWVDRLNWDHTIGPTLLNHAAFGYLVFREVQNPVDTAYASQLPEIPGVAGHPYPPFIGFSDGFNPFGGSPGAAPRSKISVSYIANDLVTWSRGKHLFKFGGEHVRDEINLTQNYSQSGNFYFVRTETGLQGIESGSPIASFLLGQVDNANETVYGDGASAYPRKRSYIAHFGDTWKVSPKLSVDYGIRYDLKTPVSEKFNRQSFFDPLASNPGAGNLPGTLAFAGNGWGSASYGAAYPEKIFYKAFAPRLGIAYSMTSRTVVRTGYGIFYGDVKMPSWNLGVAQDGFNSNPAFSSTQGGMQAAFVLSQGFSQNFVHPPFIDPTFLNGQGGPNYRPLDGNRLPYTQDWNLTIEHQFTNNLYVSTAYVGNKGTRLYSDTAPINALNPSLLSSMGAKLFDQFGPNDTVVDGVAAPYVGWASQMQACAPYVAQALMPYPQYCGGLQGLDETAGNSTYHSLQIKLEKRASHGIWMLTSYTLSKLLTDVETALPWTEEGITTGIISPFQRGRNKSLSSEDVPQTLSVAFTYELPFGRGKHWLTNARSPVNEVLGGWEASGVFHASSASPFIFTSSYCNVPGEFQAICIPGLLPGANPFAQSKGSFDPNKPLFNAGAFEQPSSFNFYLGQGSRVSNLRGFPYYNQDFALIKDTQITERVRFQIRAEFFNLWNWHSFNIGTQQYASFYTNLGAFTTDVASPSFGMWNGGVTAPRNIQVGARLTF